MLRLKRYIDVPPRTLHATRAGSLTRAETLCRDCKNPNELFVDFALRRTRTFARTARQTQSVVYGGVSPGSTIVCRRSSSGAVSGWSERMWAPRLSGLERALAATSRAR